MGIWDRLFSKRDGASEGHRPDAQPAGDPGAEAGSTVDEVTAESTFKAQRELSILAFDGDEQVESVPPGGRVTLRTSGLAAQGHPELEMVQIPADAATAAASVLNLVADTFMQVRAMDDGDSFATGLEEMHIAAKVFDVGSTPKRMRVQPVEDESLADHAPWAAISTITLLRARMVFEAEDDDEVLDDVEELEDLEDLEEQALASLRDSVRLFPGDPARRDYPYPPEILVNHENHLTYQYLAQHDDDDQHTWYRGALDRSPLFEAFELGAVTLEVPDREQLVDEASELIRALLDAEGGAPWGDLEQREDDRGSDAMGFLPTPVVFRAPEMQVGQALQILPVQFRRCFYEEPVRSILASDEAANVVADLLDEVLRERPRELLLKTRNTRDLYLSPTGWQEMYGVGDWDGPRARGLELAYSPWTKMLSAVAAQLGRHLAAGLDLDMAAAAIVGEAEELPEEVRAQLDAHREREDVWFSLGLSLD